MSENNIRYFYVNLGKIIVPNIEKKKKGKNKKSFHKASAGGLESG